MRKLAFLSIVSPIYNDIAVLPKIMPQLEAAMKKYSGPSELVIIDDESHDGSRQWITNYAKGKRYIRLYQHAANQGIAQTYRELYRKAAGDVVVLFSLDGEWNPKDACALAFSCQKHNLDIVVGVRTSKQYTIWRNIVSYLYNVVTRVFFGVATKDAGSIKAFRKDALNRIPITSHGVFDEAERLIRAQKMGYRIGFIPVSHVATTKKKRGIRLVHVVEAMFDSLRLLGSI